MSTPPPRPARDFVRGEAPHRPDLEARATSGTRIALLLLPAGLSALVLGAHFLFHGQLLLVAPSLALLALLWVRRAWAARTLQAALALAAAEWVRTLLIALAERRAAGQPWERMAAILGGVAGLALIGAALLETSALRQRFGTSRAHPPG